MTKLQLQLRLDTKEVDHTYIQTCFVDIGRWTTVINQVSVCRLDTRLTKPIEQRTVTKTKQKSLKLKFYSLETTQPATLITDLRSSFMP